MLDVIESMRHRFVGTLIKKELLKEGTSGSGYSWRKYRVFFSEELSGSMRALVCFSPLRSPSIDIENLTVGTKVTVTFVEKVWEKKDGDTVRWLQAVFLGPIESGWAKGGGDVRIDFEKAAEFSETYFDRYATPETSSVENFICMYLIHENKNLASAFKVLKNIYEDKKEELKCRK